MLKPSPVDPCTEDHATLDQTPKLRLTVHDYQSDLRQFYAPFDTSGHFGNDRQSSAVVLATINKVIK